MEGRHEVLKQLWLTAFLFHINSSGRHSQPWFSHLTLVYLVGFLYCAITFLHSFMNSYVNSFYRYSLSFYLTTSMIEDTEGVHTPVSYLWNLISLVCLLDNKHHELWDHVLPLASLGTQHQGLWIGNCKAPVLEDWIVLVFALLLTASVIGSNPLFLNRCVSFCAIWR